MIEIKITSLDICKALLLEEQMLFSNKHSFKRNGLYIGCLGEVIYERYDRTAIRTNTFHYDFTVDNKKVDVKTKLCSSQPRLHYECSVYDYFHQDCDKYVFIRINKDHTKAWILGEITKDRLLREGKHCKAGNIDPTNNLRYQKDSTNILIRELNDVKICKV